MEALSVQFLIGFILKRFLVNNVTCRSLLKVYTRIAGNRLHTFPLYL